MLNYLYLYVITKYFLYIFKHQYYIKTKHKLDHCNLKSTVRQVNNICLAMWQQNIGCIEINKFRPINFTWLTKQANAIVITPYGAYLSIFSHFFLWGGNRRNDNRAESECLFHTCPDCISMNPGRRGEETKISLP